MPPKTNGLARWLNNGEGSSSAPLRRQSSLAAAKKMQDMARQQQSESASGSSDEERRPNRPKNATKGKAPAPKRLRLEDDSADFEVEVQNHSDPSDADEPDTASTTIKTAVKRKAAPKRGALPKFDIDGPIISKTSVPPERSHSRAYHRPLLLQEESGRIARDGLLSWFDRVASSRQMPWRKKWIDPAVIGDPAALRSALEKRAYEVWISEIMLQQTRVAVVIDYWNKWIAKWPTIQDLASAETDEVLSAWRGLGYYSRATRIHEAAKKVVADPDMKGLLPPSAVDLEAKVPGVGRYTAGAISSIVFGHAAAMVDGNVLRVLSRQIGLYGNVKSEKAIIDVLWLVADRLVQAVAGDDDNISGIEISKGVVRPSDRPGRWGQALMELGSTICTPKPDCTVCPIQKTCRAFSEGLLLAEQRGLSARNAGAETPAVDIEDLCNLCEPFADETTEIEEASSSTSKNKEVSGNANSKSSQKQATLSSFAFKADDKPKMNTGSKAKGAANDVLSSQAVEVIIDHARKFPLKVAKKAVREEETLVCAVLRKSDGHYLIQKRPDKGLLAGMWEFPSQILPEGGIKSKQRKVDAQAFVTDLVHQGGSPSLRHVAELGSVPWLFSHLKLTMHVHLFVLDGTDHSKAKNADGLANRWASDADVESESMGTGMRKCWALVRAAKT